MTDITPECVRALLDESTLRITVAGGVHTILIDGKPLQQFTADLARAYLAMAARVEEMERKNISQIHFAECGHIVTFGDNAPFYCPVCRPAKAEDE